MQEQTSFTWHNESKGNDYFSSYMVVDTSQLLFIYKLNNDVFRTSRKRSFAIFLKLLQYCKKKRWSKLIKPIYILLLAPGFSLNSEFMLIWFIKLLFFCTRRAWILSLRLINLLAFFLKSSWREGKPLKPKA